MVNIIEKRLKYCKRCKTVTKQMRNSKTPSGFMLLVHLAMTVATGGIWLVLVIIWKLLNFNTGGWVCSQCGGKS